jgi:hypothetical protein
MRCTLEGKSHVLWVARYKVSILLYGLHASRLVPCSMNCTLQDKYLFVWAARYKASSLLFMPRGTYSRQDVALENALLVLWALLLMLVQWAVLLQGKYLFLWAALLQGKCLFL